MTTNEFLAWLDGYLLDRAQPDAMVIAEKARSITAAIFHVPFTQPRPYSPATQLVPAVFPYTTCTNGHLPGFESLTPGAGSI